ncbi:MAG TPA: type IX secretion system protein PorQ [Bacteroidota bacterium]|nr:type IX secretion system protein PorQ [Bacteroidota bacterium]
MRAWRFFLFFVLSLPSVSALGATNTVYDFLRSDVGARPGALAGSFIAVADDPASLFYNPAALGTLSSARLSASFFKNLLDVNAGSLVYGQSIGDLGTFGAGVIYQNYGSFNETDEVGNVLGTFTASDLALEVGYANTLDENLYYGVGVKFIYSSLAGTSSTAIAGDAGLFYMIPESRLTFGFSIRNAGSQLSTYLGVREDLPLDVSVGASIVPKGLPLLLNVGLHKLNQDVNTFAERFRSFTIGGEFTLSRVLQLRVGYDNEQRRDLVLGSTSGLTGFSIGLGINVDRYRVDYALSSLGNIGSLHRVSISIGM